MDNNMVTVRAVVSFPNLVTLDQMSQKYSIQLGNLSAPAIDKLEELGMNVKLKDDAYNRGSFVECKSKFPIDNSGKYPVLMEADGTTPFEGEPTTIGAGSVVRATLKTYDWSMGGRTGVGAHVVKLSIEEIAKPEVSLSAVEEEVL
jgi:hypothetical protein|tara:strand:+ start:6425 stop:6862 length:438 start_codon:yes stop_codon:yes gene_type:complete